MILKRRSRIKQFQHSFIPKLNSLTSIPIESTNDLLNINEKTIKEKIIKKKSKEKLKDKIKIIIEEHDFIENDFNFNELNNNQINNNKENIKRGFLIKLPSFKHFELINNNSCLLDGKEYKIDSIDINESLISNFINKEIKILGACNKLFIIKNSI